MTDERYKKIMADLGMPNSRSLLSALQQVANEVAQERDKCSFMGPMRDCPTHGDSNDLAALRELCRQLYQAERTNNQQDWTAVIRALEKVGADTTAN